ncbi:cell wall hydrolase [Aurantiacibacter poecillastricola]|uniref:cell wall hydrolase n=1 Tax=Aurantiacibacter poecillastricola TaxID=3064385 RepID=UPI00273DDB25|nr:cell wall hydrolase [Aurantiacibacter sp. 219JJ12-13]MDP5263212.1 cell wall hydrolase [Aurantiacibacter sp. 219JJ12-13]
MGGSHTGNGESFGKPLDSDAEQVRALTSSIEAGLPAGLGGPEATSLDLAKPFTIQTDDPVSLGRASRCLTEAIYYEAGAENDLGQRAVAQVVLNRLRNSEFPNSVCGVVYQGSSLATGCQFTFTCDGSLAHLPSKAGWARARDVAHQALAGHVVSEVGLATHYHANYVRPYWSGTLNRIGQIGSHVFYVWRGQAGKPAAFEMTYDATEVEPIRRTSVRDFENDITASTGDDAEPFSPSSLTLSRSTSGADAGPAESGSAPGNRKVQLRPLSMAANAGNHPTEE